MVPGAHPTGTSLGLGVLIFKLGDAGCQQGSACLWRWKRKEVIAEVTWATDLAEQHRDVPSPLAAVLGRG